MATFPKMFGWYNPGALLRTGVDVAFSTIFGRNSDVRTIEAITPGTSVDEPSDDVFDYTIEYENSTEGNPVGLKGRPRQELWIDYVADVGDGWDSTYAVAYHISQDLKLNDGSGRAYDTKRGAILIMGGDEVYPVASRAAYKSRLVAPYEAASKCTRSPSPHLFVVPGNHDWYDSLSSFLRMFCAQRWFAGWKTRQARSYFALQLPNQWWLVGTDVQLGSDIDDAQVKYFQRIASECMKKDDRIILCNAEPHWIYAHIYGQNDSNYKENNLAFLENTVFVKQHIAVYLAGDLHHYRRHESEDRTQKITAGGGGAFLHPTHGPDVSEIIEQRDPEKGGSARAFICKTVFPSVAESSHLCWRNLGFVFLNPKFGIVTAILYLFTSWAVFAPLSTYQWREWSAALKQTLISAMTNQTGALWIVTLVLAVVFFTDTHSRVYRWIAGPGHALAHLAAVFLVGWAIDRRFSISTFSPHSSVQVPHIGTKLFIAAAVMFGAGWIIGSEIMGIYLWISLNLFRRHQNEAFSSLHIQDFKNFLRLHIDREGVLTIYPIGIRRVPRRWKEVQTDGYHPRYLPDDENATLPALIEVPVRLEPRNRNSVHNPEAMS